MSNNESIGFKLNLPLYLRNQEYVRAHYITSYPSHVTIIVSRQLITPTARNEASSG